MEVRKANTTRTRRAIDETIESENRQRFNWYQEYTRLNLQKPEKRYFTKHFIFNMMKDQKDTDRYRFRPPNMKVSPKQDDFKTEIDEYLTRIGVRNSNGTYSTVFTQPATDQVKSLLSTGLSHDTNGRVDYLQERYKIKPEDKYKFPISTSMSYGWRFKDRENLLVQKTSTNFLNREIEESFFRHNGVFTHELDGPIKTRKSNRLFDGVR
jgi:hypothetical protein